MALRISKTSMNPKAGLYEPSSVLDSRGCCPYSMEDGFVFSPRLESLKENEYLYPKSSNYMPMTKAPDISSLEAKPEFQKQIQDYHTDYALDQWMNLEAQIKQERSNAIAQKPLVDDLYRDTEMALFGTSNFTELEEFLEPRFDVIGDLTDLYSHDTNMINPVYNVEFVRETGNPLKKKDGKKQQNIQIVKPQFNQEDMKNWSPYKKNAYGSNGYAYYYRNSRIENNKKFTKEQREHFMQLALSPTFKRNWNELAATDNLFADKYGYDLSNFYRGLIRKGAIPISCQPPKRKRIEKPKGSLTHKITGNKKDPVKNNTKRQ